MASLHVTDLFQFVWRRAIAGYEWRDAYPAEDPRDGKRRSRFLTAGPTPTLTPCEPFKEWPALYYKFAELKPTEDAVAAFAREHGTLGIDTLITLADKKAARGESLDVWRSEIARMRHGVRIFKALERDDRRALARMVSVVDEVDKGGFITVTVTYLPDEPAPWGRGVRPGVRIVKDKIGDLVWSHAEGPLRSEPDAAIPTTRADGARVILRWLVNEGLHKHTSARLLEDSTNGQPPFLLALHIVPSNLLGALWLEFALAISGEKYQQCAWCRRWFRVKPKGRRADTKFCSPKCRTAAQYKKLKDARRLAAKGVSSREIAGRLQTGEQTINRWLRNVRGRRPVRRGSVRRHQ